MDSYGRLIVVSISLRQTIVLLSQTMKSSLVQPPTSVVNPEQVL